MLKEALCQGKAENLSPFRFHTTNRTHSGPYTGEDKKPIFVWGSSDEKLIRQKNLQSTIWREGFIKRKFFFNDVKTWVIYFLSKYLLINTHTYIHQECMLIKNILALLYDLMLTELKNITYIQFSISLVNISKYIFIIAFLLIFYFTSWSQLPLLPLLLSPHSKLSTAPQSPIRKGQKIYGLQALQ